MVKALITTESYGLKPDLSGKVRDIFDLGDRLLIVATDRISAYDVILPDPIPGKGIILTQMTLGWYDLFSDSLRTHFITSDPNDFPPPFKGREEFVGRSMLVIKAERFDVECVVRGYLAGSGWKDYKKTGSVCGIPLRDKLQESSMLDQPIFTPATKAESGHDENISFEEMCRIVSAEDAETLKKMSLRIYAKARDYAGERGIILADTKFEFGRHSGEIILIDELLSPDSSRFWPKDLYEPGRPQVSFDKQFVRDYLDEIKWNRKPPAPELSPGVIENTMKRYREACSRLFPDMQLEKFL
ncbi:MAG: phosphoribosylaminoimidazolesuccinocarboxamide synthase [Candidatus Latescibacteria bacterium]|nr:phosphoribosylaminoimidazolesuccinocarboxamide synthase [Candidatus Latescibacterota bacterium]NIM21360.1 phosphoribosylaminoimidazolesuccinocarboxamide synthase [Candidatus Latescibacterota bacterium]NIM65541.1 phosphoribosylaminoimidazolesuccinocarboxamide synthase [Candidatus Latescibacterota bacterium]NIO01921.1 phosphoribosylaminoimidazolesuccinocarboxamide synthase [Candidatus Latescibacterota bacterium]NIO28734.1 phosphoribosylaminoimidazolesuccinocarboxamide synthase [Candidatus Late